MRKRSCRLAIWLTVLAFSSPAFYVLFRFNKPGIFSLAELGGKVVGAAGCSIIVAATTGTAAAGGATDATTGVATIVGPDWFRCSP